MYSKISAGEGGDADEMLYRLPTSGQRLRNDSKITGKLSREQFTNRPRDVDRLWQLSADVEQFGPQLVDVGPTLGKTRPHLGRVFSTMAADASEISSDSASGNKSSRNLGVLSERLSRGQCGGEIARVVLVSFVAYAAIHDRSV